MSTIDGLTVEERGGPERCGPTHYAGCDCREAEWAAKLAAAEARAEEATREVGEARDQNAAIKAFHYEGGKLDAVVVGDAMKFFSLALTQFYRDQGAENYVEMGVNSSDGKDRFVVTVQRVAGKSPHVLRREAESERDALASRLAEAEAKRCEPGVICPTCVRAAAAESRLARAEEALRKIAHYGWYAKAARVARAALAEVK